MSFVDYDKRDVRGLAGMGPIGWLFAGLLLWIVAFPLYLIKRGELKAAGERRRQLLAAGAHALPPATPPGLYGAPYGAAHAPTGSPYGQGPFSPAPPRGSATVDEAVEQIKKLDELRTAGILTDAEFQHKKTEILART